MGITMSTRARTTVQEQWEWEWACDVHGLFGLGPLVLSIFASFIWECALLCTEYTRSTGHAWLLEQP